MTHPTYSKLRNWRGTTPGDGQLIAVYRHQGVWWALFLRGRQVADTGWVNMKLAADRAPGKANYWLGWSPVRGEFAHWPDNSALRSQLPKLYAEVMDRAKSFSELASNRASITPARAVRGDILALDIDTGMTAWAPRFSYLQNSQVTELRLAERFPELAAQTLSGVCANPIGNAQESSETQRCAPPCLLVQGERSVASSCQHDQLAENASDGSDLL